MAEEQQQRDGQGFVKTITKRALAPIIASATTAATAYLMRKAAEVLEQRLVPKIQEKGGGRAVVRDTLETAADKVGSQQLGELAEKLEEEPAGGDREEERRRREQRRRERRRALEQTGSS